MKFFKKKAKSKHTHHKVGRSYPKEPQLYVSKGAATVLLVTVELQDIVVAAAQSVCVCVLCVLCVACER